ncbi:hypothetical protein GCM10027443_06080 [Pontibacter brevis]
MEQIFMTTKVISALQEHEELVKDGTISSFSVFIQQEGILIKPAGSAAEKEVKLIQELHTSLRIFFYGVDCIEHNSFDYATLKSFINASVCTNRLAS